MEARAVGPAVSAAIRASRATWADDRGANFSYEMLPDAERDGGAGGGDEKEEDAAMVKWEGFPKVVL